MQINPPERLKIGPYWYDVRLVDSLHDEKHRPLWGRHTGESHLIELVNTMPDSRAPTVLLHEALHALFELVGIGQEDDNGKEPEFTEEVVVTLLSPHLVTLLQDNPELVDYLSKNNE